MTTPGKLTLDRSTGKLQGPPGTVITYNDPWPLVFARPGVTGQMDGVVLHTMDGSLASCIAAFNSPHPAGSAHLGIGQNGRIHQFVPIGRGFETYHAFAANLRWYGIETEDQGDLEHHSRVEPIADPALWAWGQCYEFLSRFAGFPLRVNDDCTGRGLSYHRMCHDWNLSGHTCPGATMTDMTRVSQRSDIVHRAQEIRGTIRPPAQFHAPHGSWTLVPGTRTEVQPVTHDVVLKYRQA